MSTNSGSILFIPGMALGFIIALILVGNCQSPSISIPKYQKIRQFEQEHDVTLTVDSQGRTWLWVPKIQKSVLINVEGNVVF